MDKRDEFDLEQDFDFDPNEILDNEPEQPGDDFDFLSDLPDLGEPQEDAELDDLLSDDFLAALGIERTPVQEPAEETQILTQEEPVVLPEEPERITARDEMDADLKEFQVTPAPTPAFDVEPELGEEFIKTFEEVFPESAEAEKPESEQPPVPVVSGDQQQDPPKAPRRRKKMSRERIIKEVYLPPAILALTLILIVTFIGSAISRSIAENKALEESLAESKQQASSALALEAQELIAQADVLAKGYDYDAAIALLDTFSADKAQFQELLDAYNTYTQAKSALKPIDDAASIPNLSFHCLIADPARAFTDKEYGKAYNTNYVTIDEFSKILDQLYANGYVLVDFNSFIVETVGEDGKVTYSTQAIYLPEGKKPLMLTETLVNYELFTIDSDGNGEADKGGDGFASKLVIDAAGNIVNEMVDAEGNTVYGAYDFVPILENFIAAHPDFCYRGARAILAVSGEDGVFGYRIMHSVKDKKGEDYYNEQVEGAKAIAAALREKGYTIACYTYANVPYGTLSATKIQVDLDNWKKEVKPVLGDVPILVYAKASDISADGNYEGGKYNVLKDAGFRYFISSANVPYAEINVNYVRQSRIMVTGQAMTTSAQLFSNYFDCKTVLNELRGG